MSSAQSRPVGDNTPAPPVFSYAQAAKGRATATAASAVQSHQSNLSGNNTPAKDTNSTINTPSGGSERGDKSINGSFEAVNKPDSTAENKILDVKGTTLVQPESSPTSPSFGTVSASSTLRDDKEDKEDDFILVGHPGSGSVRDRTSHDGSGTTEKQADSVEGRKGKKGKKQKGAEKETEKDKEEIKPEVLVPAPLPAVNFWLQRKEELAKVKPTTIPSQSPPTLQETPNVSDPASPQSSKINDSKKRSKVLNMEDGEKAFSAAQNGGSREGQIASKGQKKSNESQSKFKEDQSNKRTGPKGNRWNDREDKPSGSQLPPPVEDAISWPTPDTALEEEKRKFQEKLEREEKDEGTQNKPRPKEKWVPVPYIPTVTFNTPLPPRGGRGRGGARTSRTEPGRPNHTQNGGTTGEKAQVPSGGVGVQNVSVEKQDTRDGPRATSLPPAKRQSTDQSSTRKASTPQATEKGKSNLTQQGELTTTNDPRTSPGFAQQDTTHESIREEQQHPDEISKASQTGQGALTDIQNTKPTNNQRNDQNLRTDHFKDSPSLNKESNHQTRERVDGRSDRGRGGFRGRGHPNFQNGQSQTQTSFANGHSPTPNGYPIRQSTAPYSPPLQQGPFNNQYPSSRGGRGGSRSQSIPNNAMYGRYPPNGGSISQHITPLQTSNPMFDYQSLQQPMSAIPYQSYIDHASVLAMVTMQMEYYFSIDNLCKDVYLRKHMDSQGFVFLSFIAAFKRIQALTHDFELLRFACQESDIIELVRGEDGIDRLRRKEGWEKWVLAIDERDESTRNAGPSFYQRPQQFRNGPQLGQMIMSGHHSVSPTPFSPTGAEQNLRAYSNGVLPTNGNGSNFQPETPLSAAVPDFSPGLLPLNGSHNSLEVETTFHDDEVANLTLVFNQPRGNEDPKVPRLPFHKASSRTFSNGSIDERSITEEIHEDGRQGRTLTNGSRASESSPEDFRRSRSPFSPFSPTKSFNDSSPPVMWVKGQRPSLGSESISHELYSDFRARALKYREASLSGETHPDMKLLYEFWSHFLCRNFNSTMYTEFRQYAIEDARNKSLSGMKNLVSYYDEILNSKKKVIPEVLARHYVEIVRDESSDERPAFDRLRAAWRNGALDMKSRKKIDNLVDAKLREELERAPHQKPDMS